jgi:hypothetical protein
MFIKFLLNSKGLAGAKALLINTSKILNLQRPIGHF